jgi:hypothetical protein
VIATVAAESGQMGGDPGIDPRLLGGIDAAIDGERIGDGAA